jgi:hypothetical protein
VIEARLAIICQTPACFRKAVLIVLDQVVQVPRDGDRRLEPALDQVPQHLQTTLRALTIGRRQSQQDFPPIDTDAPDAQDAC